MVESLFAGDIAGAFACNPLVFVALLAAALWSVWLIGRTVFGLRSVRVVLEPRERVALALLAGAVVIAGWAFLVWRAA